ncbi:membrane protein insertion efficiency factor YidD [Flavivirga jejuensis]|uniref:Membrane protein insertion efficiency factor YidD n=1 Tax=Flavivirga jejuensis TaxID=870487 RepID=A0ABT8WRG0_9FLAO|nr:membrane protein insertion efficiency factor YidD [Flavivirga jejuensis]MDO5975704.1 membrane protein insertion efficiency factor YidD [Flavivirga jejuensis]
MKIILLIIIKAYWLIIPKSKRKKCIFRKSCSNYVFKETSENGLWRGLKAFRFRYENCRHGFEIFKNPIDNKFQMILPNHQIIDEKDIAKRLIKINLNE